MDEINFNMDKENDVKIDLEADDDDNFKFKSKKPLRIKKATPVKKFPKKSVNFDDKTFEVFSNPQKRLPEEEESEDEEREESEVDGSEIGEGSEYEGEQQGEYQEEDIKPSDGFASIEDEKQDLLYKFHRLESKGVKLSKKYNTYSDIREMRAEYMKIKKDAEAKSSIKFSKKMLMACVSGIEFLNKRYDPIGAHLDGWSESVMENVNDGDYDNTFERLHEKYGGSVQAPPEMELLLSLAGSAIMFHITSTMFKNLPDIGNMAKNNPEMMSNLMKTVNDTLNQQSQSKATTEAIYSDPSKRRDMNGPTVNLSQFGSFIPPPVSSSIEKQNIPFKAPPVPESVISDSDSEASNISVKKVSVSVSEGGTRRGRKPKIIPNSKNTINL